MQEKVATQRRGSVWALLAGRAEEAGRGPGET